MSERRIGRLGEDPILRYLPSGLPIVTMQVMGSTGNWVKVVLFGAQAQRADEEFRKGDEALFRGHWKTRTWEDRNGVEHEERNFVAHSFAVRSRPKNMFGLDPCPKCNSRHRYPMEDGLVHCDGCDHREEVPDALS